MNIRNGKKRHGFFTLIFTTIIGTLSAQDIPLLTQKLSNAFIYNPAVAGYQRGNIALSYHKSFSALQDAPKTLLFSTHLPIKYLGIGTGLNIYQEEVNFLRTTFLSAAFSYRIIQTKYSALSLGLNSEWNYIRVIDETNFDDGNLDPVLIANNGRISHVDFGAGIHYENGGLKTGFAVNRISSSWKHQKVNQFALNYSAYLKASIPLTAGRDILEPYLSIRKLSTSEKLIIDGGIFYTIDNSLTLGFGARSGLILSYNLSFRVNRNLQIGYALEDYKRSVSRYLGNSHEVVIRYEFDTKEPNKLTTMKQHRTISKNVKSTNPKEFHRRNRKAVRKLGRKVKNINIKPTKVRRKVKGF